MDITQLTFGIKDVVAVIGATAGSLGFIYAIKSVSDKANASVLELKEALAAYKIEQTKTTMDSKTDMTNELHGVKVDLDKKELAIYQRINEVKTEHKEDNERLNQKIDIMSSQLTNINNNLSELTGYIKGAKEKK